MATVLASPPTTQTLADLLERLGDISPARVRYPPSPGQATEQDVIDVERREDRLCELVDGVLVEKPMGLRESLLAVALSAWLRAFVIPRTLGLVAGEAGMIRLFPGLVRIPDVAFISWDRLPNGRVPTVPVPPLAPDLAVEVLSESNTEAEMARKRSEYFAAGTRLVREVDPKNRTVTVYTAPDQFTVLDETQALDGSEVLSGFTLALRDLFGELDRHGNG